VSYENFDTKGRRTRNFKQVHKDACDDRDYCGCPQEDADSETADLISSDLPELDVRNLFGPRHMPVIDFDIPVRLVPSGTPGHSHLYIDQACGEAEYFELLEALVKAGFVEKGYVSASLKRGYTSVRHPARPKEYEGLGVVKFAKAEE
jgi:hypothetical protein